VAQPILLPKLKHNRNCGKKYLAPKRATFVLKLPKVNNNPKDEKSPNLVTLPLALHFFQLFFLRPPPWGRCYDHNFLRFWAILAKKLALFSKTNVMIKILHILALI
jgi:hypothetical protein